MQIVLLHVGNTQLCQSQSLPIYIRATTLQTPQFCDRVVVQCPLLWSVHVAIGSSGNAYEWSILSACNTVHPIHDTIYTRASEITQGHPSRIPSVYNTPSMYL